MVTRLRKIATTQTPGAEECAAYEQAVAALRAFEADHAGVIERYRYLLDELQQADKRVKDALHAALKNSRGRQVPFRGRFVRVVVTPCWSSESWDWKTFKERVDPVIADRAVTPTDYKLNVDYVRERISYFEEQFSQGKGAGYSTMAARLRETLEQCRVPPQPKTPRVTIEPADRPEEE